MEILKEETFEHDGKTFMIRLVETNDGYEAAAYEGEVVKSPFSSCP